jgi:hypothetical protein
MVAVVNSSIERSGLDNFDDVTVRQLTVKELGSYVVFARVVIGNFDSDAQNATVRVTHSDGDVIDRVDIRIPGSPDLDFFNCAVSLQGTLAVDTDSPEVMELRCQTFRGFAQQCSLFAVEVGVLLRD